MARHNETGRRGEELAALFLEEKGWTIIERNWRHGRAEVDLIARDGEVLVFVEVKTSRSDLFGPPEAWVSARKMKLLTRAAVAFMEQVDHRDEIRFDVVAVYLPYRGQAEIRHLPDAFFPA